MSSAVEKKIQSKDDASAGSAGKILKDLSVNELIKRLQTGAMA